MRFVVVKCRKDEVPPRSVFEFTPPGGTIGTGPECNFVLPDSSRKVASLQAVVYVSSAGECHISNRGTSGAMSLNDSVLQTGQRYEVHENDTLTIGDYQIKIYKSAEIKNNNDMMDKQMGSALGNSTHSQTSNNEDDMDSVWRNLEKEFAFLEQNHKAETPDSIWNELQSDDINPEDPLKTLPNALDLRDINTQSTDPERFFEADKMFSKKDILADVTPTVLTHEKESATEIEFDDFIDNAQPLQVNRPASGNDPFADMMSDAMPLSATIEETVKAEGQVSDSVDHSTNAAFAEIDLPADLDLPQGIPLGGEDPITSTLAPNEPPPVVTDQTIQAQDEDLDSIYNSGVGLSSASDVDESVTFSANASGMAYSSSSREAESSGPVYDSMPEPSAQTSYHQTTSPQPEMRPSAAPEFAQTKYPQPAPRQTTSANTRLGIDPVVYPEEPRTSSNMPAVRPNEYVDALMAGMGLDNYRKDLTPDKMFQIGRLFALFSQGTIALLSSRAILKRGVKADTTMVLEDSNNPFKILPSGKTVLMQMFATTMPGFTPPEQAVRDALIDVQSHQLGMIAGMRALIFAMLRSFDPYALEEEARQLNGASRMSLPMNKKAAMWDLFVKLHKKLEAEVNDDFHGFLGDAFLQAYNKEVEQYKRSQDPGK